MSWSNSSNYQEQSSHISNLSKLKLGESALIVNISPESDQYYRQRLLSRGILPGVKVQIKNTAPFGDPIEVAVLSSGHSIIVRKNEANVIQIIKLPIVQ
jgi:ferrous iron transport protein A